jgi:hemolysin III
MNHIQLRPNHSLRMLMKGTISAQLHFIGFLGAIAGTIILLNQVYRVAIPEHFWACVVYSLTGMMVFGASTLYHFLSDGFELSQKLYRTLKNLDHFSVYLFIAGTYTPFVINAVAPPWRQIILIMVWTVAVVGILYTAAKPRLPKWAQHRIIYTSIFVLMGWALMIRIQEIFGFLDSTKAFFLVAGGLSYTFGAVIYASKRPRLFHGVFGFHELWHIMVMLGFAFHYFLILDFYIH